MFVITIEYELSPNPGELITNLLFVGIVHVPANTLHVVFVAVVIPLGNKIYSVVFVGSKDDAIVKGVDRVRVIWE